MPRSHPPTLLTLARRTLREECSSLRGRTLVAAVSGGGDSQAMLHVLSRLSGELGFALTAHGVDHGLRPAASAELDLAQRLACELGVPFERTRLEIQAGGNLQARARAERYAALRRAAARFGGAVIATAHHADDRAETVLLRMLRGSGPRGLSVLEPHSGDLVRPLIRATRDDVRAHLARHALPYAEDPSNSNRAFSRVRVRSELMPLLRELSPQIVRHLNALADSLALAAPPELCGIETTSLPAAARSQLKRAQILEAQRASRLGRSVTIRLAGGRDVRAGRASGSAAQGPSRGRG
jgi:tRNA(Ile)-lysidine synthase